MSNRARTRQRPGGDGGSRPFPTLAVVVAAVVAVVAVGILLAVVRGDDDDGDGAADAPAFGPVSLVEGTELTSFEQTAGDAAVGATAPTVRARTPEGEATTVGGAGEEPTLVVFLAHWCPHCQAEVPVLVDMAEDGAFEGTRLVGILTGTNADAPNFPPVAWLEREGWPGEVLLDDDDFSAAAAYGLAGYPFMVVLDADGRVVARTSGEQPPEAIEAMLEAAAG